jgi:transcriptional regulator with XRE-family HTH domain
MRRAEQRKEVAQFIRDLYRRSGCATWEEFAVRAGVHAVQISDWQRGEHVPDGYNLLKLIRAADVLSAEEQSPPHPLIDSIEHLVEAIENSPALARSLEPSLREVAQQVRLLSSSAENASIRLDELLDERSGRRGPRARCRRRQRGCADVPDPPSWPAAPCGIGYGQHRILYRVLGR